MNSHSKSTPALLTPNDLIHQAFLEDRPHGDLTTLSLKIPERFGLARLVAKQDLVLAGRDLFEASLHYIDSQQEVSWNFEDGQNIMNQQTVAQIAGDWVSLIQAERVALNFLGFLSGIATQTRRFANAVQGTGIQILDTRKTLPLYREWSKRAVVLGGGTNHRMSLSDRILVKENHIRLSGGFKKTIEKIRQQTDVPIAIEATNLDEVRWATECNIPHILLDNMDNNTMKEALMLIPPETYVEASGNMSLERVKEIAKLGLKLNGISIGALTHSVSNADFSLLFEWNDDDHQ